MFVRSSSAHRAQKPTRLGWVRRGVSLFVFLAVLEYLVLPQVAGTRRALSVLGNLQPAWATLGIALEVSSLIAFSMLTRTVLPDRRPDFSWIFRSDITGLGVSHVVPAGAAASGTLRYRLLHEGGAPAEDVLVGLAVQGVGSMLVLVAMLWVALVVSIPLAGFHAIYVVAASVAAAVITFVVAVVVGVSRGHVRSRVVAHQLLRTLPAKVRDRVVHALDEGQRS